MEGVAEGYTYLLPECYYVQRFLKSARYENRTSLGRSKDRGERTWLKNVAIQKWLEFAG